MAAFWNSTWNRNLVGVAETPHDRDDVKRFVQDKSDSAEYARETIYGIVATCILSHLPDVEFRGILQPTHGHKCEIETNKQLEWGMPVISFLYAIRKPYAHNFLLATHI